ncbi:MAG: crossover junction endodeoxyribonuclease RuvC [Holosporaceae bacterium]|jgi:crossover junction endodeoxyribonuclease RuvC|nr:crossover junction endodeoxyribonuclease RuvC [Holosporaceae bacterium]
MVRIFGIDPGLHITGWGVIDYDGYHLKYVSHGTIKTSPADKIERRLGTVHRQLLDAMKNTAPQEVGVEQIFVNYNPASSLKLGMARGVALCAADLMGLKIFEYAPNMVKKTVVGSGHAAKAQVSDMVKRLLNCGGLDDLKDDAADALAVAICHAHHDRVCQLAM